MLDYTKTSLHFKILSDIGAEGKNSTVHIAHDYQLDAEIVVKKISKKDFTDASTYFDEAKKLYSSNHENIVPIQYSCQDDDNIYITMPLFPKGSLNKLIDLRPLKISEILKYSIDFLSGLHYIHSNKLIHCDIKPNNILINNSNDAILADFGLSRHLNDEGYSFLDKVYRLHWAPEYLQSQIVSHQSDIFQAGLTIYRMCNGNLFFKQQLSKFYNSKGEFNNDKFATAVFKGEFPDRSYYQLHIPQTLRNHIRRALEPDPSNRYENILDFLNDLAKIDVTYDWQFLPEENKLFWICSTDEKEYTISLNKISEDIAEVKTTKRTSTERRISDYCKDNITFAEAYKLAKEALHNKNL